LFFTIFGGPDLGDIDSVADFESTFRTQFFVLYNFGLGSF